MKTCHTLFSIIIFISFYSCSTDKGPYYTNAEGKVFNNKDSVLIPNTSIKIYNWDGNKDHDTIVLHKFVADSSGYFRIDFEVDVKTEFYFVEASKNGYLNSNKIQIDGNSTNYHHIYLKK